MPITKRRYVPKHARKKNRTIRRNRYPKQKFKFSKGLSQSVIPFTRERETYFKLNDLTGAGTSPFNNLVHTTDGGVAGNLSVKLSDLPTPSDFTNLFKKYKLNYLKLIFYPASNVALAGETRENAPSTNNNILIRTCLNRTGIEMGSGNTISDWSQLQAKKQWLLSSSRPTTITCRLSQLTAIAGNEFTAGNERYAVIKPRYIDTDNPSIPHLGLNLRFDSLDGTALQNDAEIWPSFRVVAKVYMTCKGVA